MRTLIWDLAIPVTNDCSLGCEWIWRCTIGEGKRVEEKGEKGKGLQGLHDERLVKCVHIRIWEQDIYGLEREASIIGYLFWRSFNN